MAFEYHLLFIVNEMCYAGDTASSVRFLEPFTQSQSHF